MKRSQYTIQTRTISQNGEAINANCVDITFVNYGLSTLVVNSVIRVPPPATAGQFNFITIAGNEGEIDRTKYQVKFTGAGLNDGIAIWREYKNEE